MTELQYFLGLCNDFRRFVQNVACVAVSLNKKLRKREFRTLDRLNDHEISSMETLNERLVEPPVVDLLRFQGGYTVDKAACDKQIGSVFLQKLPDITESLIGHWYLRYMMQSAHTTRCTANALQ